MSAAGNVLKQGTEAPTHPGVGRFCVAEGIALVC